MTYCFCSFLSNAQTQRLHRGFIRFTCQMRHPQFIRQWLHQIRFKSKRTFDEKIHEQSNAFRLIRSSFWYSLFGMSFMYYSVFGSLVTVVVGIVVSAFTESGADDSYSAKLLHPLIRRLIQSQDSYASNDVTINNKGAKIKPSSSAYVITDDFINQTNSKNSVQQVYRSFESVH